MIQRAVIIPMHNEQNEGLQVLSSIRAQLGEQDRMVVIATGSGQAPGEKTVRELTDNDPRVLVISAPGAFPGKARNEGIKAVPDAAVIAQVDAGWQVDDNWLAAITAPIVTGRADCAISCARPFDGPKGLWGIILDREAAFALITQAREPRAGDLLGGCPVAYKRELWEKTGGFDETLRYGEDKLFAAKLRQLNPASAFAGDACAYWQLGPTAGRMLRREFNYSRHDFSSPHVKPDYASLVANSLAVLALALSALTGGIFFSFVLILGLVFLACKAHGKYRAYLPYSATRDGENPLLVFPIFFLLCTAVRLSRLAGGLSGFYLKLKTPANRPESITALLTFASKALRKIRLFFYDQCTLELMVRRSDIEPPLRPEGVTLREFRDSDIPLFAPYFANFAETVARWRREDCHGSIIEKDGEPAVCYWWTASHAYHEGVRKPFFFDVMVGPGKWYVFGILVRKEFRGKWLHAALFHLCIGQMREHGVKAGYFYHDAAIPAIGKAWMRFKSERVGQLRFVRYLWFCKKDLSALKAVCE